MAFTQNIVLFSTPLNQSPSNIVTQFNTLFGATETAIIQDIDYSRLDSPYGAGDLHVRVGYGISTISGLSYEMRLYRTTTAQTAQAAFNADFQAGFCAVPLYFLDISEHEVGRSSRDQFLVIFADTNRGVGAEGDGLTGHQTAVFAAEPLANIAAGATGNARIYDANGVILDNSHQILNIDTNLWVLGERGIVIYDIQAGQYIGIPTCCGAAALTTVTTVTTAPPVPCITQEVVSVNPQNPNLNAWA